MRLLRSMVLLLLAVPAWVGAQQALELIPLRHSTVDQVLPALRPFLEPAGIVSQAIQVIQETTSGFEVVPRLTGERVVLDIAPQRERFTGPGGPAGVESQRLSSSVSGRLGEWFEIGGAVENAARDDRGLASSRSSSVSRTRAIWVKVEELR